MRALLLAGLFVATTACAGVRGSGVIRSETREIADFAEVDVSGGLSVTIRDGAASMIIEGDDNLLALYRSEVKNGRLVIEPKELGSIHPTRRMKVMLTTPHLRRVEASGGVELSIESATDKRFELDLSGGVEARAEKLDVDSLGLEASGGVSLDLAGRAKSAVLALSGGVDVDAKGLALASAKLDASGGCEVDLTVTQDITGDAAGGVDVTVYGNPPKSRLHTSGGSDVTFRD